MKGDEYIRVTHILYPYSGLDKVPIDVLKNASERGSKIHEICSAMVDDLGVGVLDPDYSGYIKSFEDWMQGKEFVERPSRLYCDKYKITGEIDGLYKNETGLTLFDIKTPAKESKTWSCQGSAYSYLCKKSGLDITKIEFVKLSKDGSEAVSFFYEENMEIFLKCLDLYKYFFLK